MLLAQHKLTDKIYLVVGTGMERGTWWHNFIVHYIYVTNKTGRIYCFKKDEVRIISVNGVPIEEALARFEENYDEI